jgi:DNA-binding NarL/FixJ family response regulator
VGLVILPRQSEEQTCAGRERAIMRYSPSAVVAGCAVADTADLLETAREAYRRRDWASARAAFAEARDAGPLDADDLCALASCAWWLGDLDAALPAQQGAYTLYLEAGDPGAAAIMAMDVGYTLMLRGEDAQSSGWMRRAVRLLEGEPARVEHGYLDYIVGFEQAFHAADLAAALEAAHRVRAVGQRFADPTLTALGVLGEGRVLVKQGRTGEGMALLDEAMVAATSDDIDPTWAGNIYCHLMVACDEIADMRRAGEWTEVTARWCERMPGAGPFMGICRVHRARALQVRGEWSSAEREATRVCDELSHFDVEIVAEAHYQLGDLRRQRGDLAEAEVAFRRAHRLGRDPQPGLALLRLAQGETGKAAVSIRAALAAADADPLARAQLLPAAAEIAVAAGDLELAHASCAELARNATTYGTTGFAARAAHARGMVLLAGGDAAGALQALRQALVAWQELSAPYEAARVRLLLARAYEAVGDRDAAALEQSTGRDELTRLGAAVGGGVAAPASHDRPGWLTDREAEVLSMVANGMTNRQIADQLVLSVRTVERHLATVYEKLGVHGRSARAAAVSFALREGILA